ncbi:MAG: hypothetical protein ACHQLQ_06980 [Candidatus Acidiferrales bacterium]
MNRLQKKSLRMRFVGTVVLLGLAVFGGTAIPAFGQDTVQGKIMLPVEARLGKTVLPAGKYNFSVVTMGNIRSVGSIQAGSSHVRVMVWSTTKGGPFANVVAMASRGADTPNPKPLDIRADGSGMMIHSMCLAKLGLVIKFNESKTKNVMRARGPELQQGGASVKGSD